jgi:hypothetical protein
MFELTDTGLVIPPIWLVPVAAQIRSIVALALAAPANPTRATTLPTAAAKNLRIIPSLRLLKVL